MKKEVRFVGFDDSPFRFEDERVRVVGVVTRGAGYVEGVLSANVDVDGSDATATLAGLLGRSRFRPNLRAVFLQGVTLGGFNIVDLDALHEASGIPVLSVVRSEPRHARVKAAIEKHFPDAAQRLRVLDRLRPKVEMNGKFRVWVVARGVEGAQVSELLHLATVRGAIPEPIRLAHVVAGGIERGESRGPA